MRMKDYGESIIYFLPQIHKTKRPDTGTFPGRPIVSSVRSNVKEIDLFLTNLTQRILKKIPGSLSDTRQLINDVEKIDLGTRKGIIFSADVE